MKTYPSDIQVSNKATVASLIYGNRFHADQTLYEYLIEFLLVFCSEKPNEGNGNGKLCFHNPLASGHLEYWVEPRIGLKRFIFFDKNKRNDAIEIDKVAYQKMIAAIKARIEDAEDDEVDEIVEGLQDLLHGYAVVLKKRTWCAQAMLPICPELIFCEAMPKSKSRAALKWENVINSSEKVKVDTLFDFDKRNFLARGGELYYLHILQGLVNRPEQQEKLENLLRYQLVVKGKKMTEISDFIQGAWEDYMEYEEPLKQKLKLSFIPESAYKEIATASVDELINYMCCDMHPIKKIELLAKGVMIQIMRMMSIATTNYLCTEREHWIIDMGGLTSNIIKKLAARSLYDIKDTFTTAIGKEAELVEQSGSERLKLINKARKDSFDIFKSKGKELQCIIPTNGPNERFSLPEDSIRFLVLALVPPGEKVTLDMFLEKLYERYRIVIGPNQYRRINRNELDVAMANSFKENELAFQTFLRNTGFLRELSDATSIVVNPYNIIEGDF